MKEKTQMLKIAIGSDHGGVDYKTEVIKYLESKGYQVKNVGTDSHDSCHYPIYGAEVGRAVASKECEQGIVICTTGIGISISANKVKGIRCALCSDVCSAELTRLHNDANVLALGAGIVGSNLALRIVDAFLDTKFSGDERHSRRISKIEQL